MKKIILSIFMVLVLVTALSVMISAANLVDQTFESTTGGELMWAYFETDGTLGEETYTAGTLVIYGDGTKFTGIPWSSFKENGVKKLVINASKLTSVPKNAFSSMRKLEEAQIPASFTALNSTSYNMFQGDWSLHTIKVVGVDYAEYGDAHIYDLRNIKSVDGYTFNGTAKNVEGDVTVLVGNDTKCSETKNRFASTSAANFTFVVRKGTTGETFANYLKTNASSSSEIADKITVKYYDNLIDQDFASATGGEIKWAFFEDDGTLEYNQTRYAAHTLVIYGDGTGYSYATPITWQDKTGYPWYEFMSYIKTVVFDTPNLEAIQHLGYMGASFSEIWLPDCIDTLYGDNLIGAYNLHTIKMAGVDYSAFGDKQIYDLRGVTLVGKEAFKNVGQNADGEITVLLAEGTHQDFNASGSHFAGSFKGTLNFMVHKGSAGEEWVNKLIAAKESSANIADNITFEYYPEITSAISFGGFQVRTKGYNGLRCLFTFDKTVANTGATCIEYGAILSSLNNKDKYGTKLSLVDGEYVTADSHIVKKAINRNGEFVNKVVSYDDKAVTFCTALVQFANNWKSELYVCGYEIWRDSYGNIRVVYTDVYDSNDNLYTPSIYDAVLLAYTKGVVNGADQDENKVLWSVLDNCRDEISATPATYIVENNIIKHTSADVNIHLFTATNASDVAIITGSGSLVNAQAMLKDAGQKPVTVVIDHGFTQVAVSCFEPKAATDAAISTIVYPDGITFWGNTCFQRLESLQTMFKVHTEAVIGTVDLSYVGTVALAYMFNGNKPKIEYIHLPTNLVGWTAATTQLPSQAFKNCTALKAIWCGENPKPVDGTADFTGTTIKSASGDTFSGASLIVNFIFAQ